MSVELEGKVVVPGDKLGPADGFKCGSGCYTAGPYVYASVVGVVSLNQDTASAPQEGGDEEMVDSQPRVNVVRRKDRFAPVVPNTDNIVIAKVKSINARSAKVMILSVEEKPVKQAFPAMIRSQDVRELNKDDVQIVNSFRPGDFVRATVISLGDTRSYYLSTAGPNLGVVHATCDGVPMVALGDDMMQCPNTLTKQPRKVALK